MEYSMLVWTTWWLSYLAAYLKANASAPANEGRNLFVGVRNDLPIGKDDASWEYMECRELPNMGDPRAG